MNNESDKSMVDILMSIDERFVMQMMVTVASLRKNNPSLPLRIHLLTTAVNDADKERIHRFVEQDGRSTILFYEPLQHLVDHPLIPKEGRFPLSAYMRCFATELLPTDLGTVVNDFLVENFPNIVDYNFTANMEKEFDEIAEGKENWQQMMGDFYQELAPECERLLNEKNEHRVGERVLGTDPKGQPVVVKIGRFGPVAQIGTTEGGQKARYARLGKGQSIQNITLDEALELFRLPRTLGQFEKDDVVIGTGRFGPYVCHQKKYVSLPKDADPLQITLDEAVELIRQHRQEEADRHLKTFDDVPDLEIINGRFGPYIIYKGNNYRIPKTVKEPTALTSSDCLDLIKAQDKTKKKK